MPSATFDGFHVVGEHRESETPVDEGERCEEACHCHVLYPACFNKEEADEHQQYAVDELEPPVAASALVDCAAKGADAPEDEDEGNEVGEYCFGEYDAADHEEADEHVDDASGKPPSPASAAVRSGGDEELDNAHKDEQPSEDLGCYGVAGYGPEPISETADDH